MLAEDAAHLRQNIHRRTVDLAGMVLLDADEFFGGQEAKNLYSALDTSFEISKTSA